jgi:UDP-N-acetylmuramoyl-tripeptide--D-alanyl-D-alanine ligase
MIAMTLQEVAECTNGQLVSQSADSKQVTIRSVSTDTRAIDAGALFIALVGPQYNAHHFVDAAKDKGAIALIVSEEIETSLPYILVEDTKIALGDLGAAVKQRVMPKTVGVTGSSGKTTVKEMAASILARRGKVLATKGNFNNDIGVPLTLLRLEEHHEFAVIEMGANHLGEIAYTTNLVKPDVATIVNAAAAHLEGFGSLLGVARAKSEIYRGLSDDGVALVNADSQFAEFWKGKLKYNKVKTFGEHDADFFASDVELDMDGCPQFMLSTPQGRAFVTLTIPGGHNVSNALCAAALCMNVGATLEDIQLGLSSMPIVAGRLNIKHISSQVRLLDDTYNANVGSVKAATDLLATYPGRRILVLGDMGELGEKARFYHQQAGEYALQQGVDNLLTLGVLSQSASDCFSERGGHFHDIDALVCYLEDTLRGENRDISILVKGSRSARMERVVEAIEVSPVGKFERFRGPIAC